MHKTLDVGNYDILFDFVSVTNRNVSFAPFSLNCTSFGTRNLNLLVVKQARLACRNFRINYYAYRYRYTVLMMMSNDLVYETLQYLLNTNTSIAKLLGS